MDLKTTFIVIMNFKNGITDFFKLVLKLYPNFKELDNRILKIGY